VGGAQAQEEGAGVTVLKQYRSRHGARGKFNAVKTVYNGREYDSKGEAGYAMHLDALKAAGAIRDWEAQVPFVLVDAPHPWKLVGRGKVKRPARVKIVLIADFRVWDTPDTYRVVDYKGVVTPVFRLKAALWLAVYPQVPLYIVKADGTETRV
jgi:hypothetical protein